MSSDLTPESDLAFEDKALGQDKLACEFNSCEKFFKSKKSLKEHTRIHNDERPYSWYCSLLLILKNIKYCYILWEMFHTVFFITKT